jgi:hypothetical protein
MQRKAGLQKFVNNESIPWIKLACFNSNNGNYPHNDSDFNEICY